MDASAFLTSGLRNLIVRGVYNTSISGFRWTPGKKLVSGNLNRIAFSNASGNYYTSPYNSEGPYGYYSISFWYKVENYSSGSIVNVNINDISCGNFDVSSNKSWTFWYGTSKERTDGNRYGFVDFEGSYSADIILSDIVVVRGTNISQTWFPAPEDLVDTYNNQNINGIKTFGSTIKTPGIIHTSYSGNQDYVFRTDGGIKIFEWSEQSGTPSWVWGGNNRQHHYVYSPANFSVNYATLANSANILNQYFKTDTSNWNADNLSTPVSWYYGQSGGVSNKPGTYGGIFTVHNGSLNNSLSLQIAWDIYHDYSSNGSKQLWWRGSNNKGWQDWEEVITSKNISSQSVSNSDTVDGKHDTDFLRRIIYSSLNTDIPTDWTDGLHLVHRPGIEYSSVLVRHDYPGSYWQLYFHPTSGYTQNIQYRASNCTSWKTILDSNNSGVSKSGETLTVKINGTSYSLTNTNTWRGIQDNLTSTSTTDSLSANQGRILNNKFDSYVTLTTTQTISGNKTFNVGCFILQGNESNEITTKHWSNNTLYDITDSSSLGFAIKNSIRFRWYNTYWVIGNIRGGSSNTEGFGICFENSSNTHHLDTFRLQSSGNLYLRGNLVLTTANWSSYITTSSVDDTVWQDNSNDTKYKIQVVPSLPSSPNSNTFYVII